MRQVHGQHMHEPLCFSSTQAVVRPLGLEERMAVLACAISVDYDFFSQHSSSGL